MENSNIPALDCPPKAFLYVERSTTKELETICRSFNLIFENARNGFLLQSKKNHENFKFAFLDLFFAGLAATALNIETSFFLFEKNSLRDYLETGILGKASEGVTTDAQISYWQSLGQRFSLSGLAQVSLHQAGLLSHFETGISSFSISQLQQLIDFNRTKISRQAA